MIGELLTYVFFAGLLFTVGFIEGGRRERNMQDRRELIKRNLALIDVEKMKNSYKKK